MDIRQQYMTVTQAAKYLGVHPQTLRNWDRWGRVKAFRQSVSNYRLYTKEDLDALRPRKPESVTE